jgi:CheY-like chemotaxis protein
VEVAGDGVHGLQLARRMQPDVVLCDIGLPGEMTGYRVAEALRQDPDLRGAYLIALTGYGCADDRERSRRAGFDLHLTKPAGLAELHRALAAGLAVARRRRGKAGRSGGTSP